MDKIKAFMVKKNIVFSAKRYGIDALGAMAQGLDPCTANVLYGVGCAVT